MSHLIECEECGDIDFVIEWDRVECASNGHLVRGLLPPSRAQHEAHGVVLMREAIDLPFTDDKAAWEAWCKDWAARAEAWIKEASE